MAFKSFIHTQFAEKQYRALSDLDDLLRESPFACAQWSHNIRAIANNVKSSILEWQNIAPRDLTPLLGYEGALDKAQWCILMYGRLLLCWEDLNSLARSTDLLH